jgi:putative hydrolase of the HAD superfamily
LHICQKLGVSVADAQVKQASQIRFNYTLRSVKPRPDALETLAFLKAEGYKTGLISDCSTEVPTIWKETPLAPLIDVAVFSCVAGVKKPDPRIYQVAIERLGDEPQKCLYIGDGSSQELTGALKAGMYPVLIRVPYEAGEDAYRIDEEEWHGAVISSLKEVLSLL